MMRLLRTTVPGVLVGAFLIGLTVGALPPGAPAAGGSASEAATTDRKPREVMTLAEYIDTTWLRPHDSLLTGDMVVACAHWYAPEGLEHKFMATYLAVCACETSLGDPVQGGRLVPQAYNFGCVKSGSPNTPWGELASGTITVGGKRWWRWPTAWTGAAALGRLIKTGPGSRPGFYLRCIQNEDWRAFTGTYYGKNVAGYESYHKRWVRFYNVFLKGMGGMQ